MHTNLAKNTMSKILAALMIVALAVGMLPVKDAYAATCTWTGAISTDWADASNWSGCGGAPQTTDIVVIPDVVTNDPVITVISGVSGKVTIAGLDINSGGVVNGGPFRLIVQGNVVVDGTFSGTTGRLVMDATGTTLGGSGTITFSSNGRLDLTTNATAISILSGSNLTVDGRIDVKAGVTVTNNGTLTVIDTVNGITGNNATTSIWINAANSTLNIDGPLLTTGTLTATAVGNTVNYNGAAQTVKATTYNNLTLSGSGVKTFATTPTVNGVLSMEETATVTVTTGVVTYGANATLQYNTATSRTASSAEWVTPFTATGGVIIANTGAIAPNAAKVFNTSTSLTINNGATLNEAAIQVTMSGGSTLVVNGTLDFTSSSGLIRSGTSGTTTLTMGTTGLIRTVDQDGLGPVTNASLQTQTGGAWTVTSISTNGTVEYNRDATSAQTVTDRDYNNLTITGSTQTKTWTLGADRTVNGNVTINASAPLILSGAQNVTVKGDWSNNGTFTPGASTVTFNGSSAQTIGGMSATTFNNLTINNDNGVSLNGVDATVNGTGAGALTFTSGKIITGANNTLIMGASTSTVAGAGAGKYVYGNLQKAFIAGSGQSVTFEIGDSANYTPAQLASLVVNADNKSITAATTTGSHANLGTSNIDGTKYVSRYWTLTPSAPASFGAYNATFTFVPGDLIGAPDTTKLIVQKYSGAAWGSPVSSASTATTVTGTGFTGFSDFAAGLNKNGTTPVTVSYFKAEHQGDSVNFTWSTATETGNVGFNLYVETGGELVQINDELIPSQAVDSLDRLDYSYQANVDGNIFYIEDVSVLGDTRRHGPFGLGEAYGGQVDTDTIDWLAVREQNKAGQPRLAPDVMEAAAGANRLDLKVSQTGMYRMTYEMLRAAGLNLGGASLNKIMLTNRGKIVPIYVNGSAKFGPGAYIEFYGKALDTLYTDTNIYTLKLSGRPAAQIPLINAKPAQGSKPPAAYIETMIVQNQRSYASYSPSADPWYDIGMLAYTTPKSYSFPFQVDGLNNPSATTELKLVVWGMTALPQNPDHRLLISINDIQVSSQTFDGMVEQTLNVSVPGGVLQEGANTLQLTLPGDTGAKYDLIYMDKFSLNYARRFQAQDGRLTFTAKGKVFKVTNLPGRNVVVYRNDKNGLARLGQVRVQRVGGTFTATFAGSKQAATYMVSTSNAMYAPAFEAPRPSVNLNNPAQYLIISHPDFINGIQPLVQARQAQGMTVSVVDVNDLYAKYTYGVFDPAAIQQYIVYAAQNLGTQYVLLVGGDTYDYRNYLGVNSISFIPSLFVSTSTLVNFVPVDPLYADLNGDKSPDLAIGRFPVRTVAELDLMVNKTLSYQNKDYARTAVFTSDVFDGVNGISFKNISNALASGVPQDWSVENLHLDDLSVISARERLIAAMNRGAALVTFTGHSGATEWTFSNLFNAGNVAALTNHQRPFVVVQWGCWNTYYVNPVKNYLVQSFLFSGDQGAAAVLGSSTLTDSESERLLGELLTPRLVMPGLPLGQALQDAKSELALTHPELLDVLLGWSLMGDPTLVIEP